MQLDTQIRNHVGFGRALGRCGVDPILDRELLERCALHDRLADDALLPAEQLALRVEAGAQPVQESRPVIAAAHVVLAHPDEFDR